MASSSARFPYSTPMPVGPNILCARERIEVAVERLHVDAQMRHCLRAVDEHDGAGVVRLGVSSATGLIGAERVRDVRQRDDPRPLAEQLLEPADVERAVVADRRDDELRARLLAEQLPRNDVRVVLEPGDQHLVARLRGAGRSSLATRLIDSVVPRVKTISARRGRVDEASHLRARALVGCRRALAELVHAAMDVRVIQALLRRDGLVDRDRRLRDAALSR